MIKKIDISARTIIFTIFFLISLFILWELKDLLFSLFIALIIASALKPVVNYLESKKIPRSLASIIIYLVFVLVFIYLFVLVIPPLAGEIIHLSKSLPIIIKQILPSMPVSLNFDFFTRNFPGLANQTVSIIISVFSNIVFVTSTLFFGFYFLNERDLVIKLFGSFFEDNQLKRYQLVVDRAQIRMSHWFWGEIILMIVVGVLTYIGLTIIGMKYALALAVLAGLLEVVPNLGPTISAIPAIIIGLSVSPILGFYNLMLYIIVQQLENNIIVPVIMKKVVGLNPIVTLIALIAGGKLAGVFGVLLAVPTSIFIETIIIELQKLSHK